MCAWRCWHIFQTLCCFRQDRATDPPCLRNTTTYGYCDSLHVHQILMQLQVFSLGFTNGVCRLQMEMGRPQILQQRMETRLHGPVGFGLGLVLAALCFVTVRLTTKQRRQLPTPAALPLLIVQKPPERLSATSKHAGEGVRAAVPDEHCPAAGASQLLSDTAHRVSSSVALLSKSVRKRCVPSTTHAW
jgi:hypothetical protein